MANSQSHQVKVSVIIVNFNSGQLLSRCIQSIRQSSIPVDIIVVDNHSSDNSIAEAFQLSKNNNITFIQNTQNTGFAHASNQALEHADGKYWLFLNPDCIVKPETIAEMQQLMEDNPDVAMSGPLIVNPDGTEQRGCRRTVPTPWRSFVRAFGLSRLFQGHAKFKDFLLNKEPLPETPVDVEAISGAFMFVRSSVTKEVGLLDEGYFLHCEDLDWCMRFRLAGWRIVFTPDVKIMHVKGGCSESRFVFVQWHMHCGMVRFYRKFFKKKYPGILMWLVMLAVWLRFGALLALNSLKKIKIMFLSLRTKLYANRSH